MNERDGSLQTSGAGREQAEFRLTSTLDGPDQVAGDMTRRLLSTPPGDWVNSFG